MGQLKALTYFVVGVGSEGNFVGRDVSNRLSFAGKYRDGKIYPVENSGLTIGTLQKDLGQDNRETANAMVIAYQRWAAEHSGASLTDVQRRKIVDDLSRNGRTINKQGNRPLDPHVKNGLDTFLMSDGGKDFVHQRDMAQVDRIYNEALSDLALTQAYQQASSTERIEMAAIVAKGFNQNERIAGKVLLAMEDGGHSVATIQSLDDLMSRSDKAFSASMRHGRDIALGAAAVYTRLQQISPDNPLHAAWQEVLKDPLIKPTATGDDPTRPDLAAHYTTIKNLFLEPRNAIDFIDALERGGEHSKGSPTAIGDHRATSGFFASGSDFVQWNADGRAIAYIGGQWSQLSRDDISRTVHDDRSVDLAVQRNGNLEPLLHVGPTTVGRIHGSEDRTLRQGMHGDDVRALQTDLARLGFTDARGRAVHPDGDFGPTTQTAIQAFQRDHELSADGIAGPATLAAVRHAVETELRSIGQPDAPYLQNEQPDDAMAVYQSLAPEAKSATPLMPTIDQAPPEWSTDALQAATVAHPNAERIRALQENLNTLGVADMKGDPLVVHGTYDAPTQTAVARFQSMHDMPVTGLPDEATLRNVQAQAFVADLQQVVTPSVSRGVPAFGATREAEHEEPDRELETTSRSQGHDRADPRHPDSPHHELYNELQRSIPEASEDRLLQFTAACHENQITAGNLSSVHLNEETLTLTMLGTGPLTSPAQVDLSAPPPQPEQAIEKIQQFDRQQSQMLQAFQEQNMQLGQGMSR
ncbi:peptidoglycan hydrolase-like protein with peptidoglycan-binding domain [Luteibacter jiangsuensis]|uniref:Peptidoglycan hydrolase-like protein with peptidoglycan-binding domain n=1 Tax=Luteibacter jiangsuensis TaxID=637577 RepID=A0ABT9SVM0_9GAMM|nr:peptidoglycan-binding protein [Luteibacter jiangsuensis]MDQ0008378.1 peptidoglycan hydrolase-like protein with peptidoglycan-binding domain [Luteibacter jiangsuensis]